MIYEYPEESAPIRQGDIFANLPRVEISLHDLALIDAEGAYQADWADVANRVNPVNAILPIRTVYAIVMNQDCDTTHGQDITLCEVRTFRSVEGKAKETRAAKKWMAILTRQARLNLKWFYLPPDPLIGFDDKMAADFRLTIRLPRVELEQFRSNRRGRLNEVADEHFRERLSEFFRRYPYDEWYSLDEHEFEEYRKSYPDAEPFPWQNTTSKS